MTGSTGSAGYLKVERWFTQIGADCRGLGVLGFWIWCLFRAAEVCSAEATELPVWKRPPVSVANGLCHPKTLDHGSNHPTKPLRTLAGTPTARDDEALGLVWFVSG